MSAIISRAAQDRGWASKLFSSALFCLWLSLGSVVVWFDLDPAHAAATADEGGVSVPADAASAATPAIGDANVAPGRAADTA
jgi:hypothetical protein